MTSEQLSIVFAPMQEPKRPRPDIGDGRRSINQMVDLALARGSASSVPDLLRQISALTDQALFNALLAVLQFPRASHLLTREQWEKEWGRRVRPTEHPIVLQWPYAPVIFLFDVAQTEPTSRSKPLPVKLANPWVLADAPASHVHVATLVEQIRQHGVLVEFGSHGWSLAGRIRRVAEGEVLTIAPSKPRASASHVPLRWRSHINAALSNTEQLMTLAHEVGHLFCGHVGADKGDPWDQRPSTVATQEFEAEAVAYLVMERLSPGLEMPESTRRKLTPAGELPPHDWTTVFRASERILKLVKP